MADIIHQISASTQLQVQAASTHATRIGSTYAVSGNNIELGTTSTTDANGTTVTTSNMGGLTAGTAATSLDAATMVNGTYQIKTAGDAFSLTESFTLGDDAVAYSATSGVIVEDLSATAATSTAVTTTGTDANGDANINNGDKQLHQPQMHGVLLSLCHYLVTHLHMLVVMQVH